MSMMLFRIRLASPIVQPSSRKIPCQIQTAKTRQICPKSETRWSVHIRQYLSALNSHVLEKKRKKREEKKEKKKTRNSLGSFIRKVMSAGMFLYSRTEKKEKKRVLAWDLASVFIFKNWHESFPRVRTQKRKFKKKYSRTFSILRRASFVHKREKNNPMTVNENFNDSHWQSMTVTDRHWPSLTVTDRHWPSLTVTDSHWQSMTVNDSQWQSKIVNDNQR